MRLLPKKQANIKATEERRSQIDEGVQLAQKIDKLRETLASLEEQQKRFVEGTREQLSLKTKSLFEEIRALETEVQSLESRRTEMLGQLEPMENLWKAVSEKQDEAERKIAEFKEMHADFLKKEKTVDERLAKAKDELMKARIHERELAKARAKAESLQMEAEKIHLHTLEEKREAEDAITSALSRLEEADMQNHLRAQENENFRELLDNREAEVRAKEKAVDDKYNTLLRTLNRKL